MNSKERQFLNSAPRRRSRRLGENMNLKKLADSLEDCTTSTEYVRVIRRITRTQDPDAIVILASVLDTPGPVGAAAVRGLKAFGQLAEGEMRRCVATGVDEDAIRNAHRVLAALGDRASKRAVSAHCWADLEEEAAEEERAAAGTSASNDVKAV
jgi:hypothetical protein